VVLVIFDFYLRVDIMAKVLLLSEVVTITEIPFLQPSHLWVFLGRHADISAANELT
jgi:hypothetical protein